MSSEPSQSVPCHPRITPLSWHTGQCQRIVSSSSRLGTAKMMPEQRRCPGRLRQRNVGGSSRFVVASTTMLAKYSARSRAREGIGAIAPVGVR